MQSHIFDSFENACWFLRNIGTGMVKRNLGTDVFVWYSEGHELSEQQQKFYDGYFSHNSTWHDDETNLTWLVDAPVGSLLHFSAEDVNKRNYAGYNDWRYPTLRELKSLASNTPTAVGTYVKNGLCEIVSGMYKSRTPYDAHDSAWWCFDRNTVDKEDYRDGKIMWGNSGEFGGFEKSRTLNSAKTILVRGVPDYKLSTWAETLVEWAEKVRLHNFPATQINIETLESLEISYDIKSLPNEILSLARLKNIKFYGGVGLEQTLFLMPSIENIKILSTKSNGEMEELPESLGNLINLVSLEVGEFLGLRKIPTSIGGLRNITSLIFRNNKITELPESILDLCNLVKLDLTFNELAFLPKSIGMLKSLEDLSIAWNKVEAIPDSFVELENLKRLFLNGSKITQLPKEFGRLKNLETFYCTDTLLSDFPETFHQLEKLQFLNFSNGNFSAPPSSLKKMPWLKKIINETKK